MNVPANNLNGPWSFSIGDVPAYPGLSLCASFSGPWSMGLGGGTVGGESGNFDLAPNGTATQNVELKAVALK
jgi:hypothetical protein